MVLVNREGGFTLVEILIVLAITFTLLFVSGSFLVNVKDKVTAETYLQQFKLLTYEAYGLATSKDQVYWVRCSGNEPDIFQYPIEVHRKLYWPKNIEMQCYTKFGNAVVFTGRKTIDYLGGVHLNDHQVGKRVRYSVNFSYGRLRKDE